MRSNNKLKFNFIPFLISNNTDEVEFVDEDLEINDLNSLLVYIAFGWRFLLNSGPSISFRIKL
jgi:hypothetical protein